VPQGYFNKVTFILIPAGTTRMGRDFSFPW